MPLELKKTHAITQPEKKGSYMKKRKCAKKLSSWFSLMEQLRTLFKLQHHKEILGLCFSFFFAPITLKHGWTTAIGHTDKNNGNKNTQTTTKQTLPKKYMHHQTMTSAPGRNLDPETKLFSPSPQNPERIWGEENGWGLPHSLLHQQLLLTFPQTPIFILFWIVRVPGASSKKRAIKWTRIGMKRM